MTTYYKIIHRRLRQGCFVNTEMMLNGAIKHIPILTYSKDEWVAAPEKSLGIFLFRTIEDAQNYLTQNSINKNIIKNSRIVPCKIKGYINRKYIPTSNTYNMHNFYRDYYSGNSADWDYRIRLPKGTICAKQIMCLA